MNVVIIGAGGHGRVVLDILRHDINVGSLALVDDDDKYKNSLIDGAPVLGKISSLPSLIPVHRLGGAIVAIGDNKTRARIYENITSMGLKIVNAIHPDALIARDVVIGEGVVIAAGAIIGTGSRIGNNVIINTGVTIEVENIIEDHTHISPGVNLAGRVRIKKYTHIGLGVCVIDNIIIGENVMVGAGAIILKEIPDNSLAVGTPARVIRQNDAVNKEK
jgi:sugar O-acyltransferase (sialic acid O-acetyltransferase NeuD family)